MLILFTKVEGGSTVQTAGDEDARGGDVYGKLAQLVVTFLTVRMEASAGSCTLALEVASKYNLIHLENTFTAHRKSRYCVSVCYINRCLFEN